MNTYTAICKLIVNLVTNVTSESMGVGNRNMMWCDEFMSFKFSVVELQNITHTHTHTHRTEWKETARWLKFVEVAEPGAQKWSKPHVSTLSMHSLFQLRALLSRAAILLDQAGNNMPQIAGVSHDDVL